MCTVELLIIEKSGAKKRVSTGVFKALDILKERSRFCRHYLSSLAFIDLMGSTNCETKIKCCDSILAGLNAVRSYGSGCGNRDHCLLSVL